MVEVQVQVNCVHPNGKQVEGGGRVDGRRKELSLTSLPPAMVSLVSATGRGSSLQQAGSA